jgi:hypothetical protein
MTIPFKKTVDRPFDPTGWLFYCDNCQARRPARLAEEQSIMGGGEYFDLVCTSCSSILLTMQRANSLKKSWPKEDFRALIS